MNESLNTDRIYPFEGEELRKLIINSKLLKDEEKDILLGKRMSAVENLYLRSVLLEADRCTKSIERVLKMIYHNPNRQEHLDF